MELGGGGTGLLGVELRACTIYPKVMISIKNKPCAAKFSSPTCLAPVQGSKG